MPPQPRKRRNARAIGRRLLRLHERLATLIIVALSLSQAIRPAFAEDFQEKPSRPNIVFILADDLGAHDLACYGSTFHRTPRLDALAKNGIRFTQAYAACPVCSPTRAALMTGKTPARTGITDWLPGRADRPDQKLQRPALKQQLPLEEVTLAEMLKTAGYATGHIGKWDLGGEGFSPLEQGFDVNIAGDHTGTPRSYFAPFKGQRQGDQAQFMRGLEDAPDGQYLTDRLGIEAEKFIAAHTDQPFFLYLPHYGVHTPMKAPADLIATYDATGRAVGSQQNPIYAAMLESLDSAVGRVVDALAKHKLTEQTLVIFTSDNGGLSVLEGPNTPATSNAPLREGKGYLYEGGIRVPLIACGYGVKNAGRTDDTPVWSCDVVPTVCELVGLPSPKEIDGVSIVSLFENLDLFRRRALYWHYPHYANQGGKPGGAIRLGHLKLIEDYETGRFEVFDLSKDPRESTNLGIDSTLEKQLADWRREAGALMPTPNPNFAPNPQAKDGTITLPARTADVFGSRRLRYEPAPHKNTLGFWTDIEDVARWEFTVTKPGWFEVELLQGCGKGQGGSVVEVTVTTPDDNFEGNSGHRFTLSHTVEDTGHFQNFVPKKIGKVYIRAEGGRRILLIQPQSKAANAIMDVRQVTLRPTTEPEAN